MHALLYFKYPYNNGDKYDEIITYLTELYLYEYLINEKNIIPNITIDQLNNILIEHLYEIHCIIEVTNKSAYLYEKVTNNHIPRYEKKLY